MAWDDPTGRLSDPQPDEFANWITYTDVKKAFPTGRPDPTLVRKLYQRLVSGRLVAASESASWVDAKGTSHRRGITTIDPSWWAGAGDSGVGDAFEAGDLALAISDPNRPVNFFNLRLEWAAIFDALPGLRELLHPPPKEMPQPGPIPTPSIAPPQATSPTFRPIGGGNDISEEEYRGWFEPGELLDALPADWSRQTKISNVANLLQDGLVRAVAEEIVSNGETAQLCALPHSIWRGWASMVDDAFWDSGLREVFGDHKHYRGLPFRAYRVRLERGAAETRLPLDGSPLSGQARAMAGANSEPSKKLRHDAALTPLTTLGGELIDLDKPLATNPPLSEAHLQAWWAFYQAVRPSSEQTSNDMAEHIARCFPEHSVSRSRLRDLRGPQKRGPKPKAAE